jgi:hypothetical protein
MDSWHANLGLRHLPREVTAFEIEVFFQFSADEARIIEGHWRQELKLELVSQMGFCARAAGSWTRCGWCCRCCGAKTLVKS